MKELFYNTLVNFVGPGTHSMHIFLDNDRAEKFINKRGYLALETGLWGLDNTKLIVSACSKLSERYKTRALVYTIRLVIFEGVLISYFSWCVTVHKNSQ